MHRYIRTGYGAVSLKPPHRFFVHNSRACREKMCLRFIAVISTKMQHVYIEGGKMSHFCLIRTLGSAVKCMVKRPQDRLISSVARRLQVGFYQEQATRDTFHNEPVYQIKTALPGYRIPISVIISHFCGDISHWDLPIQKTFRNPPIYLTVRCCCCCL